MFTRYITFGVSLITLAVLLYKVDVRAVIVAAASTDLSWLLLATLVSLAAQVIAGIRLRAICRVLNRAAAVSLTLRAHFIGLWFNQVLPTGMGGDVARFSLLHNRAGGRRALRAILLDRVYGLVLLVAVLSVQVPAYVVLLGNVSATMVALVTSELGVLGILCALLAAKSRRIARMLPLAGRFLILVCRDLRRAVRWRSDSTLVVSSLVFLALSIFCYALIANAISIKVNVYYYLAFVPLIFIVMQVPISWGGWGPREAATMLLFSEAGVSSEDAFVMAVLFGAVMTLTAFPGLFLLAGSRGTGSAK